MAGEVANYFIISIQLFLDNPTGWNVEDFKKAPKKQLIKASSFAASKL